MHLRESGRTLLYLDAYAYRGRLLRGLCLYDYMSMVSLVRRHDRAEDERHIALLTGPPRNMTTGSKSSDDLRSTPSLSFKDSSATIIWTSNLYISNGML